MPKKWRLKKQGKEMLSPLISPDMPFFNSLPIIATILEFYLFDLKSKRWIV